MQLALVVLIQTEALCAMVRGAEFLEEPLAEGSRVCVVISLIGGRRLGLGHLWGRRARLGALVQVGIGDVDREPRGVGRLARGLAILRGVLALPAKDLRLQFLQRGLRHRGAGAGRWWEKERAGEGEGQLDPRASASLPISLQTRRVLISIFEQPSDVILRSRLWGFCGEAPTRRQANHSAPRVWGEH